METNAGSVRKMFTGNYCHKGFKNRLFNFKMTLQLGENGHNIPSVDFVSDSEGNATRILAVDINGNLVSGALHEHVPHGLQAPLCKHLLICILSVGFQPRYTQRALHTASPVQSDSYTDNVSSNLQPYTSHRFNHWSRGWGVLSLPIRYFKGPM